MSNLSRQSSIPSNLCTSHKATSDKILAVKFERDDLIVDFGIIHRIEFTDQRCNVILKNQTTKKQDVNVRIWVLNFALIELWSQSEKWSLSSIQPGQAHAVSWAFTPELPDCIWNEKARVADPLWVVMQCGR